MSASPLQTPRLSVVVVIVSDTNRGGASAALLSGCLEALMRQEGSPPLEIIVPYHSRVEGIDTLKAKFPQVQFVLVESLSSYTGKGGSREHHDELRACGLRLATGELIGLLEDHGRPDPHWASAMAAAHRQDCAGVGGAIECGSPRALNAAICLCDFGRYQNPLIAGPAWAISDANSTYKRADLDSIRPIWQHVFHETKVNAALSAARRQLLLEPTAVVEQHRGPLRLLDAIRERFVWGRSYAAARCKLVSTTKKVAYFALSPCLPIVLTWRLARHALRKPGGIPVLCKTLPFVVLLNMSWSLGECIGYLTGAAAKDVAASPSSQPRSARPETIA